MRLRWLILVALLALARGAAGQTIGANQCCDCPVAVCSDSVDALGLPCVSPCTIVSNAACADYVTAGGACNTFTPTATGTRTNTPTSTATRTATATDTPTPTARATPTG